MSVLCLYLSFLTRTFNHISSILLAFWYLWGSLKHMYNSMEYELRQKSNSRLLHTQTSRFDCEFTIIAYSNFTILPEIPDFHISKFTIWLWIHDYCNSRTHYSTGTISNRCKYRYSIILEIPSILVLRWGWNRRHNWAWRWTEWFFSYYNEGTC